MVRGRFPSNESDDVAQKQKEKLLTIAEFPQLAFLTWNRASETIPEEEAFLLYERNWRYVEPDKMTDRETTMVAYLTQKYGHGVLNV